MSLSDAFGFRPHLEAYWLRPESAVWDAIAAKQLHRWLDGKDDLLELGIGNGFFSFLLLGGRFSPAFDWFRSVDTTGFSSARDIYDHDAGINLESYVVRKPATRIRLALDHKQSLLAQAARLSLVDEVAQHDCNLPLPRRRFTTCYSNMLYWLDDPLAVVDNIADVLPAGGELVMVFPNSRFFEACESYTNQAQFWQLLNRGRARHICWHMNESAFRSAIDQAGKYEVRLFTRYLNPLALTVWDIGLRPLSGPLIQMANGVPLEKRTEIKQQWCDILEPLTEPIFERELETGAEEGGFNLAVLVRR